MTDDDDLEVVPVPATREPSSKIADRIAALKRARLPALALLAVGFINGGLGLFLIVMGFFFEGLNLKAQEGMIGVMFFLAGFTNIGGALNLLRLDSYSLLKTGAITAMVPCISPCLILGLPIGVWALVTASSPDVRRAFRNRRA